MEDYIGRRNLIPRHRMLELSVRSDLKGAWQTTTHFGAIGVTGVALGYTWGTWWAVPIFVVHGMMLNFLFAAQHELNHYTAFRTRWVNDILNRITGFVIFYPRSQERWYHYQHHRYTQDWTKDPELVTRRGPYRLVPYLLYLIGVTYWLGRWRTIIRQAKGEVREHFLTERQRRHVIAEARGHVAGYIIVAIVSVVTANPAALIYWLLPLLSTKVLHQIQNITEHTGVSHEPDTVHNTRTIRTNGLMRWMGWNMQYHTAHHTYPAVPFHRLPELHREMVDRLGYEPPTVGYLQFQYRFIKSLLTAPEPLDGVKEVIVPLTAGKVS